MIFCVCVKYEKWLWPNVCWCSSDPYFWWCIWQSCPGWSQFVPQGSLLVWGANGIEMRDWVRTIWPWSSWAKILKPCVPAAFRADVFLRMKHSQPSSLLWDSRSWAPALQKPKVFTGWGPRWEHCNKLSVCIAGHCLNPSKSKNLRCTIYCQKYWVTPY